MLRPQAQRLGLEARQNRAIGPTRVSGCTSLHVDELNKRVRGSRAKRKREFQLVGDARLERAAFGSGDQRSIHLS